MDQKQDQDNGEVYVSMENLFLYTLNELEGNVGFLMSDQFASHPLRVLLVVLSGMPLPAVNSSSLLQSKRKEHISVSGTNVTYEGRTEARMVPDSFHAALDKMMASAIGGLETTYLRALATHPIANPALQLLLELELTRSAKQSAKDAKSLFRKLLPDDPLEEGTESVSFINSLIYDAIGSRLVEIIITHAPGKNFKALYKSWLREKLGTLAKNEVAAFVVIRIVERLNKEDLKTATEQICSQIDSLIKCSRTSVIKVLIERCRIRQVDCSQISAALEKAYGDEPSQRLMKMLYLDTAPADGMAEDRRKRLDSHDRSKAHGSLLAQCMLESPDPLRGIIADSLLAMDETSLMAMAKDRTASRVLQSALVCHGQTPKFRRLLIPCFYGHMEELANDPVASHVVDSLWTASSSLTFIRERIADELAQHESSLRACISGRAVWRNWKMDSYKTRRKDWLKDGKEQEKPSTTSIELARERFAAGKTTKQRQQASKTKAGKTTGANSIPQGAATSHTSHGSRNSLVGVA